MEPRNNIYRQSALVAAATFVHWGGFACSRPCRLRLDLSHPSPFGRAPLWDAGDRTPVRRLRPFGLRSLPQDSAERAMPLPSPCRSSSDDRSLQNGTFGAIQSRSARETRANAFPSISPGCPSALATLESI